VLTGRTERAMCQNLYTLDSLDFIVDLDELYISNEHPFWSNTDGLAET
jgi:hypothetical protein